MNEPLVTAFIRTGRNPFAGATTLASSLAQAGSVSIQIYDVRGRRVRELADGTRPAGRYRIEWNGRDEGDHPAAAGIDFAVMRAPGFRKVLDLHLLR